MTNNRLQITAVENNADFVPPITNGNARRQEIQATLERLWRQNPQQFDPQRDCIQRQRLKNTIETLCEMLPLKGKYAVDLGCGTGDLTRLVRDEGAQIDAVDIATIALQKLKEQDMHHITAIQDCLPLTRLKDNAYDLVICTEVIGYLKSTEYRVFFSELARLVKLDGLVVCSSELDINTQDPLENFAALAETEFNIDRWVISHHMLFIRFCHFFEIPARYIQASQNNEYYQKELSSKTTLGRLWYQWNTTRGMVMFWKFINLASAPIAARAKQNNFLMNFLEKICRFLWSQSGISHALFIGARRPLTFPLAPDKIPRERKHKKEVWE